MVKGMTSTLDPDARHHKAALQTTTQTFIKLMKSDNHDKSPLLGLHQGHEVPPGQPCPTTSGMRTKRHCEDDQNNNLGSQMQVSPA